MFEDKTIPQSPQVQTMPQSQQPVVPSAQQQAPVDMFDESHTQAPAEQYEFEETETKPWYMQRRFIVLILAGILFLILVIFGVQFALQFFAAKTPSQPVQELNQVQAPTQEENIPTQPEQQQVQPTVEQQNPTPQVQQPTEQAAPLQPIDTDGDGLTDDEEKTLSTDPAKIDTDVDGLTDREEVKVFGTDPLKADTDGDGYADGAEVKNGYNPMGEGKLGPLPTEAQPIK